MARTPSRLLAPALLAALLLPASAAAGGPKASVNPSGALDKDEIRAVVRGHIDEIRACYNSELVKDPKARGRVVVNFVIAPNGEVKSADIAESNMAVEMETCMTGAITTWTFPQPRGEGRVMVTYPFAFEPG